MRFGKIEYLNLIVFDVFVKKYNASSCVKSSIRKSYPAKLNKEFLLKRIDAGFISSIAGKNSHRERKVCNAGIISKGSVWSVIVLNGKNKQDYQSGSSNALAKILKLRGEVLIGDRALQYHYKQYKHAKKDFKDMGEEWYKKTGLPFVFGRFCFNNYGVFYRQLIKDFNKKLAKDRDIKGIKVPHYILKNHISKIGIDKKFAREYLKRIKYKIEQKELIGLERFYRYLRLDQNRGIKRF